MIARTFFMGQIQLNLIKADLGHKKTSRLGGF